jgi:hypothetical protein
VDPIVFIASRAILHVARFVRETSSKIANKEIVMSNGNQNQQGQRARSAVAGATSGGESMTVTREDVATVEGVMPMGAEAMLSKVTDADIAKYMQDATADFAPQIKSLEPGDRIVGILEGYGGDTEFTQKDPGTGKDITNVVHTWIIRALHGSARLSILSSVQLDSKLPPFIGDPVDIIRGKNLKTSNGRQVADYMVKGVKVSGKVREWARKSLPAPPIEVQAHQLAEVSSARPPEGHEDAQA